MDCYEADNEDGFDDFEESTPTLHHAGQEQQQQQQQQLQQPQPQPQFYIHYPTTMDNTYFAATNDPFMDEDSMGDDSDYSLDYEYLGPRHPVYRDQNDADSDASELSCNLYDNTVSTSSTSLPATALAETTDDIAEASRGFDMWDEDPYSTNDFTWESNDMRLTRFIKAKQQSLLKVNVLAPWKTKSSFWRKEKGWPRQLPYSSTTTNHDQSANALCLVPSNYALDEQLYGIYRDRIVECGRCWSSPLYSALQQPQPIMMKWPCSSDKRGTLATAATSVAPAATTTTWIDSSDTQNPSASVSKSLYYPSDSTSGGTNLSDSQSQQTSGSSSLSDGSKFCSTHISISLKRNSSPSLGLHPVARVTGSGSGSGSGSGFGSGSGSCDPDPDSVMAATPTATTRPGTSTIGKFVPYTKYIKRTEFTPPTGQQHAYVGLTFEPLCLERKYGFMAIGGLEGEFELYCCMDSDHPIKIWGTKFKGRDNIMLMTNAIQIVRWKRTGGDGNNNSGGDNTDYDDDNGDGDDDDVEYDYFLFACMNEAGILVYRLPPHHQCIAKEQQQTTAQLYAHLQSFDRVPINDAKVSPDGTKMVCVGDDGFIFMLDIFYRPSLRFSSLDTSVPDLAEMAIDDGALSFGSPVKLPIPISLLQPTDSVPASSPPSSTNVQPISASSSSSSLSPMEVDGPAHSFNNNTTIISNDDHLSHVTATPYSSQHVVWNHSSEYFAHTSDTHHRVLVWRASTLDILCSIDSAGYTYAIKFHPYLDGVLAFTNRYGYFHTVDLNQALDSTSTTTSSTSSTSPSLSASSILDFDRQTAATRGHTCNPYCIKEIDIPASASHSSSSSSASHSSPSSSTTTATATTTTTTIRPHHHHTAHHTNHLKIRHEMTMVAFRGEKDRRLRILAKINGIQWSQDGRYLYVATKKRVLAYEFIIWSQQHVQSLFGLAGQTIRQILEKQQQQHQLQQQQQHQSQPNQQERKRKKGGVARTERKKRQGHDLDIPTHAPPSSCEQQNWHHRWSSIPLHIRNQVLKEANLSSHW